MPTTEFPAPARRAWTLAVLSLLMGFASISTDLYLPAMPAMQLALGASAGTIEWTVSGYLIGFSLGQLFWGPLSDRLGRRLPILLGLLLFVAGSAGCALASSAGALIAWRVLQAAGACASVVLARAMVRDLYAGSQAARTMSTLMTVMAVAPLIGPSVGGLVLAAWSWRAIFWALVGVGGLTALAVWWLPETLPPARRSRQPLVQALAGYGGLLKEPMLLAYLGLGGFFYGGMYAYVAGTPFAYIGYHHVSAQHYGLLFGLGIAGIMIANLLNARLVGRLGSRPLMLLGAMLAALAGLAVAVDAATDWGGLPGLVVPLFVFVSATGLIVANAVTGALQDFPDAAGSVAALVGATQYGTGILGSAAVGALADGTPGPMGRVIAVCGVACLLCALGLARPGAVGHAATVP